MPKPTKNEVQTAVVTTISGFTQLTVNYISLEYKLTGPPLSFDSNRLAYLALSFRGYVRFHTGGEKTVLASELRKGGLKVGGVVDLILEKIGGKND